MKKDILLDYSLLLGLLFLLVFLKLGSHHLHWWDESIFAVNSIEMMESKSWWAPLFNGDFDPFNTKPPLVNWFQILSMKSFGISEFSIRFPSAIAAALTVLVVFRFLKRNFNALLAWSTALFLITSQGFIGYHAARTGDSDSMLTLFLCLSFLSFLTYLLENKKRSIIFFFVFMGLAFSTKLFAALLFLPGILGVLIWKKNLKRFIGNQYFLLGLGFCMLIVALILGPRLFMDANYLASILTYDAGRIFINYDSSGLSYSYYIDHLFSFRFNFGAFFTFLGMGMFLFKTELSYRLKTMLGASVILSTAYLIIITLAPTKHIWYDVPVLPIFSIIAGICLYTSIAKFKLVKVQWLPLFLFIYPLYFGFRCAQSNEISQEQKKLEANEMYLFDAYKKSRNIDGLKVLYSGWERGLLFYQKKFELTRNQNIELLKSLENVKAGDKLLVSDDALNTKVNTDFQTELVEENDNSRVYLILASTRNYDTDIGLEKLP